MCVVVVVVVVVVVLCVLFCRKEQELVLKLALGMLGKNFSRLHFKKSFFLSFLFKVDFLRTICMKCQSLFYGKNKNNINLSSAEVNVPSDPKNCASTYIIPAN